MAERKRGRPVGSKNRPQLKRTGPKKRQRTIAKVKSWVQLVFDPELRDSKGHLKALYMAGLDEGLKRHEATRRQLIIRDDRGPEEKETDLEYLARKDLAAEKIDEDYYAIPKANRPPFSEYLKKKGYQ